MTRVLLVGESWVSVSTHYKGFNHFVSGVYETGLKWFSEAMDRHGIELTHMPAHEAANDFPFTVDDLNYDVIILSDIGADSFLLHPKTWLHGERTPNRLKTIKKYVERGGGLIMVGGYLSFQGITFAHTEWLEPPDWPREGRYTGAWYDVPAAIRLTHAQECVVTRCVIEHGVAYGIEVREGCRDVEISRNRMSDLGAGGVKLWFKSARTTVADNEISHTGMIFLTSYGICVGDSPGNQIIYNHIYDRHYTGILIGWSMYFEESKAYGNVVEHNHIHHIGKGVMSDMGGIYTEGICGGTRIRYNVVHDIRTRLGDNNGIYHDSGADILVERNLVYRCTPLHIHYTRNIRLENNIFALGEW